MYRSQISSNQFLVLISREPSCKLRSLNVSKCLLGSLDAGCLAETIRRARHLDALRAAGASRPADMMPLVLAVTEAPCLQLLDLASPRLALDDHPSRLLCHALARNSTLRLLSLEGWTFRIEVRINTRSSITIVKVTEERRRNTDDTEFLNFFFLIFFFCLF